MPVSLIDSFNEQPVPSVQDFAIEPDKAGNLNSASTANIAAHAAVLTPNPETISDTYQTIRSDLDATGKSATADQVVGEAAKQDSALTKDVFMSTISDPTVPLEQRQAAAKAYMEKQQDQFGPSLNKLVSDKALSAPSKGESVEQEDVRLNLSKELSNISAWKKEKQAAVNSVAAQGSSGLRQIGVEFATQILPFAYNKKVATTINEYNKAAGDDSSQVGIFKSMVMSGWAKEDFKAAFEKMPIDKQRDLVGTLMTAVKSSTSLTAPDTPDMIAIDNMRSFLEDGYYGKTESFIDNLSGVLDIVGLGGLFKGTVGKAVRVGKEVSATEKTTEVAHEVLQQRGLPGSPVSDTQIPSAPFNKASPGVLAARQLNPKIRADLIAEAGNQADKGQSAAMSSRLSEVDKQLAIVQRDLSDSRSITKDYQSSGFSRKEAESRTRKDLNDRLADLQAQKEYLTTQLDRNAVAENASQDLLKLDKGEIPPQYQGKYESLVNIYSGKAALEAAIHDAVRTEVQPMSVAETYKDLNPEKYKNAYKAAAQDDTGQVAEALFGSTRSEAIASAHTPETALADGSVQARPTDVEGDNVNSVAPPADIDPTDLADSNLRAEVNTSGHIYLTDAEKTRAINTVVNDFQNATGITARTEMTSMVDNEKGGKTISAVYGQGSQGFSSAQDALDIAKVSLRKYGVLDSDIELLKRDGSVYSPVGKDEALAAGGGGDYLARVNYDYSYDPHSLDFDTLDVKKNFTDRFTVSTPFVMDPASMFDPVIFMGANVAVDKGSRLQRNLLEMGKTFTDGYTKLDEGSKAKVWDFILEANEKGIGMSPLELAKYNFNPQELESIRKWRHYWDNQYWLENRDLGKTLSASGYQVVEHTGVNTKLFAKPVASHVVGREDVYNPVTGVTAQLDQQALDDLYNRGGTVARLRTPAMVNGGHVAFVQVENQAGSSYLRAIHDSDAILNYRNGYFQVRYKGNKFVVERFKSPSGKLLGERAIANASNTRDATLAAKRQAQSTGKRFGDAKDPNVDYYVRGDAKGQVVSDDELMFDSMAASGRTAQRLRGKPLIDASSPINFGPQYNHVMSPVDSLIHAATSIAKRTSMRDYLTATKERAIRQYAHVLPRDDFNRPRWPSSRAEIQAKGNFNGKDIADARSTYDYIASLENAANNVFDDLTRETFNSVASIFGDLSTRSGKAAKAFSLVEQGVGKAGQSLSPTRLLKSAGNAAFIACNPLRQLILQPSQAIMLLANYPKSIPQVVRDLSAFMMVKTNPAMMDAAMFASQRSKAELTELIRQMDASGLAAGVDSHSLVSGSLSQMAEMSRYSGRVTPISGTVRWMRKIGFDVGETANILSAYLAIRQDYVLKGIKLDPKALDEIAAKARNYTGNMNAAGEMKFSRGTLGVLTQYMQQPFKSAMAATNRLLSKAERGRLLGLQAILYPGIGLWAWESFFDKMPEDKTTRRILQEGLEGWTFNSVMSSVAGRDIRIDFSSLAPANMYGTWEVIHNLATMKPYDALANTPSGQLVLGSSPRITDSLRTAARYFHLVDDYEKPTEFLQVVNQFLSISSGYSNAAKARYMLEANKKLNSMGGVTVEHTGQLEAMFQMVGFPTLQERLNAQLNNDIYDASAHHKQDVEQWYKELKRSLTKEGVSNEDPRFIQRVLTEHFRGHDSIATREIIDGLIAKDMKNKDGVLFSRIIELSNLPDRERTREIFARIPDDRMREQALQTLDHVDEYFKGQETDKTDLPRKQQ